MGATAIDEGLLGIGAAAAAAGVTERALRYYEEIGLLVPSGHTKGGMRRYSAADLERVARIRELQSVVSLDLDQIAAVLRSEDRMAEIKAIYHERSDAEKLRLAQESLELALGLRATVEGKMAALEQFASDLDARISRIQAAIGDLDPTV